MIIEGCFIEEGYSDTIIEGCFIEKGLFRHDY